MRAVTVLCHQIGGEMTGVHNILIIAAKKEYNNLVFLQTTMEELLHRHRPTSSNNQRTNRRIPI